jgi:hypothetical protein
MEYRLPKSINLNFTNAHARIKFKSYYLPI